MCRFFFKGNGEVKMTIIDEKSHRNIQKSDSVEDFRILIDSDIWLCIYPDTRKIILRLIAEQAQVEIQQTLSRK